MSKGRSPKDEIKVLRPIANRDVKAIRLHFDGGVRDGYGYGSFRISLDGSHHIERRQYGPCRSSFAESKALISGLEYLVEVLDSKKYALSVYGDSLAIFHQLLGVMNCCIPQTLSYKNRTLQLLHRFADYGITWVARRHTVIALGH